MIYFYANKKMEKPMSDFSITTVERRKGSCSKTVTLKDSKITSQAPGGVYDGSGEITSFNTLEEFHHYLAQCQANKEHWKCFLAAEPIGKKPGKTIQVLSKKNANGSSVSLSKENFPAFHPGLSLMLLDYDPDQSITGEINFIPSLFYILEIAKVTPELNWAIDYISRFSSSAGIQYENSDGDTTPLKKYPGHHFYFLVNSGAQIPELIQTIFVRLILAGVYWVKPNKAGKAEVCTLVDTQAFHPHTPLLPTSAKIIDEDGENKISVAPKYTNITYNEGANKSLDISKLLVATENEIKEADLIISDEKRKYESTPESKLLVKKHKQKHAEHYAKQGGNKLEYKRTATSLIDHQEIFGNHPIWFDSLNEPVTAATLASPAGQKYDQLTLSDPLDIDRKEPSKAKFFWNRGKNPQISSFKRGGEIIRIFESERISSHQEMNRNHAILMDSNKTSILAFNGSSFNYLSPAELKLWHGSSKAFNRDGQDIKVNDKSVKKVDLWLNSDNRNQFIGMEFTPVPGKFAFESEPFPFEESTLNSYLGLQVKPQQADVSLLLDHITQVICNNDKEIAEYFINWIAQMVQHPNLPAKTAIMIKTPEGTGKGSFFEEIVAKWFGPYAIVTTNQDHIFGRFNEASSRGVFTYLNEATFGGNKQQEGALKQAITDPKKTIEEKYKSVKTANNYQHIVVTTNNDWAISIGASDRRFAAFEMSTARIGDSDYFNTLHKWINSGGVAAALHYFLYEVDVSNFKPQDIPDGADTHSKIKFDQKMRSAPNNTKFISHLISTSEFHFKQGDRNISKYNASLTEAEALNGLNIKELSGQCFIQWQPIYNSLNEAMDAQIILPKDILYETFCSFCSRQKGGNIDTKELLGRFLKGNVAGSQKTIFASETQEQSSVFGPGRKWKFTFSVLLNALKNEINSTEVDDTFNLADIISPN